MQYLSARQSIMIYVCLSTWYLICKTWALYVYVISYIDVRVSVYFFLLFIMIEYLEMMEFGGVKSVENLQPRVLSAMLLSEVFLSGARYNSFLYS